MSDLLKDAEQSQAAAFDGLAGDVRKWADDAAKAERKFWIALVLWGVAIAGAAFLFGVTVGGAL